MAAKRSKSKRPFDTSSTRIPQPRPDAPIFFLDKCLGRRVIANELRALGIIVELHGDQFEQGAEDRVWIPAVGRRGWVILTKDRHIRSNQVEIASLLAGNVACFTLTAADMQGPEMAAAFAAAVPTIDKFLKKYQTPFVAKVSRKGAVDYLCGYSGLVARLPRK